VDLPGVVAAGAPPATGPVGVVSLAPTVAVVPVPVVAVVPGVTVVAGATYCDCVDGRRLRSQFRMGPWADAGAAIPIRARARKAKRIRCMVLLLITAVRSSSHSQGRCP